MTACVVCEKEVDLEDPARGLYELRCQRVEPQFHLRDDVHPGDCHVRLGFREARQAIASSQTVRPPLAGDDT